VAVLTNDWHYSPFWREEKKDPREYRIEIASSALAEKAFERGQRRLKSLQKQRNHGSQTV